MTKKSLDELARGLPSLYPGLIQHRKSGGLYRTYFSVYRESDMSIWAVYFPTANSGVRFARPIDEFNNKFNRC